MRTQHKYLQKKLMSNSNTITPARVDNQQGIETALHIIGTGNNFVKNKSTRRNEQKNATRMD